MQTEEVRKEFSEDMSITRAFSIVFERKPELRYQYIEPYFISFTNDSHPDSPGITN